MEPKKLQLKKEFRMDLKPLGKLYSYLNDIITDRPVQYHYDKEGAIAVVNRNTSKPHIKKQKFNQSFYKQI